MKPKKKAGTTTKNESLPDRLARMRKERGVTQVELAEKIGTIQPIISDYERGRCRPNPEMLVNIADVLGCSVDELLGRVTTTPDPRLQISRRWAKRLQAIDTLSKRDEDALLRTIDAFLKATAA